MSVAFQDRCRSPIEQQLFDALQASGWESSSAQPFVYLRAFPPTLCAFTLNNAYVTGGVSYVFDFGVEMWDEDDGKWRMILDVEADGHDHHERTKEQARRDRSRDRALTKADIGVVRFTGAEIYADAYGCVDELHEIVAAEVQRRTHNAPLLDETQNARAYQAARELKTLLADAQMEVAELSNGLPPQEAWGGGKTEWFQRYNEAVSVLTQACRLGARMVGG
jgi:hypothetical protein